MRDVRVFIADAAIRGLPGMRCRRADRSVRGGAIPGQPNATTGDRDLTNAIGHFTN